MICSYYCCEKNKLIVLNTIIKKPKKQPGFSLRIERLPTLKIEILNSNKHVKDWQPCENLSRIPIPLIEKMSPVPGFKMLWLPVFQ